MLALPVSDLDSSEWLGVGIAADGIRPRAQAMRLHPPISCHPKTNNFPTFQLSPFFSDAHCCFVLGFRFRPISRRSLLLGDGREAFEGKNRAFGRLLGY